MDRPILDDKLRYFWFGYSIFTAEQLLFNIRVINPNLSKDILALEERLNYLSCTVKNKKQLDYGISYSIFFKIHQDIKKLEEKNDRFVSKKVMLLKKWRCFIYSVVCVFFVRV